jgi:hypothetical protein
MAAKIEYENKTENQAYNASKFNAKDANDIKTVVNQNADTLETVANQVAATALFSAVATYADLLALPAINRVRIVKVSTDENKNKLDTVYQIWPDGVLFYETSEED